MDSIFAVFSNRDIAIVFWLFLLLFFLLLKKSIRKSFAHIFKSLFVKNLITPLILFFDYILLLVLGLQITGFWEVYLTKDTIFWMFGFAFVLFFNFQKAKDAAYFKDIIKDVIKITVVLEFLADEYTFGLFTEIIIVFIIALLTMVQVVAKLDPKHKSAETFIRIIISLFNTFLFVYIVYRVFNQFNELLTIEKAKSFLLPIILSILFLPFIYFLSLYSEYEELFVRFEALSIDKSLRRKINWRIIRVANIRINKLQKISKNIVTG